MTNEDLDATYTYLCNAMARVGEAEAALFLGMVCLSLICRQAHPSAVLPLIDQAEAACGERA